MNNLTTIFYFGSTSCSYVAPFTVHCNYPLSSPLNIERFEKDFYYVRGGQPQAMLSYALSKNNIDLNKIDLVSDKVLSTQEMIQEYKDSSDAFFHEQGAYPHQLSLENQGEIVASVGEQIGPVAFSSLCAEKEWINSDKGKKFSKAFEKSKKWVNTANPDDIAKTVKIYFPDFVFSSSLSKTFSIPLGS